MTRTRDRGGDSTPPPRAVRGQLAVLETWRPGQGGAGDNADYQPVTVASVRADGRPTAFVLPDGRTLAVDELTHPTVVLLTTPGAYDPHAALTAARADGAGGMFTAMGDVDELFKRYPAAAPAPAGAAGEPAVLVLHRPAAPYAPAPWSVLLPGRHRIALATGCGTKARARTVAAWLEATGLDFADRDAALKASDLLMEFYREWEACVHAALAGTAPWPDRTPARFTGILAALSDAARTEA
ncbi:hypothetical protein OG871_40475 (plasmid) [Kitasatospora sp. NBC_00374]|uniref:hypothetical protein n=1 Tax=Kitasatospora sp. NBC_00374 TaxID=2975964 RepID=UPI002F908515